MNKPLGSPEMSPGKTAGELANRINDLLNGQPLAVQMTVLTAITSPRMTWFAKNQGPASLCGALQMFNTQVLDHVRADLEKDAVATQIKGFTVEIKGYDTPVQTH